MHGRPEDEEKDTEHLTENSSGSDDTVNDTDFDGIPAVSSTSSMAQPECFDQSELIDLFQKHVLELGTNVSFCRYSEKEFRRYFQEERVFVTSIDIRQLLSELRIPSYNPDEWKLFIDSSKRSLKCVLLHNGNLSWSIPIGHSLTAR